MLKAVQVGDVAKRVVEKVAIDAMSIGDIPSEGPRLWTVLRMAAIDAKARGVRISVIAQGFHVQCVANCRSEIVTFEQADVGVLDRAIDRVSPRPEPEYDVAR